MSYDVNRLQSLLLNTGLQNKDTPLYQLLFLLIKSLGSISTGTTEVTQNITQNVTNLSQNNQFLELNELLEEGQFIPGPAGNPGSTGSNGIDGNPGVNILVSDGLDAEMLPIIPGPVGPAGANGSNGTPGTNGITVVFEELADPELIVIPGTRGIDGVSGTNGLPGPVIYGVDGDPGEDAQIIQITNNLNAPQTGSLSPGSGLVLLEERIASGSASLDFTSFSGSYDDYLFEIINLIPATNNVDLNFRVSTDGGATFSIAGYEYVWINQSTSGAGIGSGQSTAATGVLLFPGVDNTQSYGVTGSLRFPGPGDGATKKGITFQVSAPFQVVARRYMTVGSGFWGTVTAVNAVRFLFSSGNIQSGTVRMYGYAKPGTTGLIGTSTPTLQLENNEYTDIIPSPLGLTPNAPLFERGRGTPVGQWTKVPFNAANFTGGAGMVVTVAAGDQITYQYLLIGKTMILVAYIDTITIAAPLNPSIFIAIPDGYVAAEKIQSISLGFDNGVGVATFNRVVNAGTTIEIGKSDLTNWSASVDNTYIRVSIIFEIN
jgi:hypothetical protein